MTTTATIKYEIRQRVETVDKAWLEVISVKPTERSARFAYEQARSFAPDEYFEIVMVEHKETCIGYTAK